MADQGNRFKPSTPILDGDEYRIHPSHPINAYNEDENSGDDYSDDDDDQNENPDANDAVVEPMHHPAPIQPVHVPVHTSVQAPIPATHNRITSEEKFWEYVAELNWRDVSDGYPFNMDSMKNKFLSLSIPDQEAFAGFLIQCVDIMDNCLSAVGAYGTLTDVNERKAICSHIVGRGSVEYAITMEEPGFMARLLPENTNNKKEYRNMMELIPH